MDSNKIITISLLVTYPILLILAVPLEMRLSLGTVWWINLVAFIGFTAALFYVIFRSKDKLKWLSLLPALIVWLTLQFSLSTRIFLGKQIGEAYVAEAPAYTTLQVYEQKCAFGHGGIFGLRAIFYCDYEIANEQFFILTEERLLDLELAVVSINGKQLEIRRKAPN